MIILLLFALLPNAYTTRQDKSIICYIIVITGLIYSGYFDLNYHTIFLIFLLYSPSLSAVSIVYTTHIQGFIQNLTILLRFFNYYYPLASLLFIVLSASIALYTYIIPSFLPFSILFCFCIIGILVNLTLLSFSYVKKPTHRAVLIVLTIMLASILICIIAYFFFRLVTHL